MRLEPCDPRELGIVRGLLLSPDACVWFLSMGIGWGIFADKRCQIIAAWALGGCQGKPPKVQGAFSESPDGAWSMAGWLGVSGVVRDAHGVDVAVSPLEHPERWCVSDVQRYARELAGRWLPEFMREQALYIDAHKGSRTAIDTVCAATAHTRSVLEFIGGEAA